MYVSIFAANNNKRPNQHLNYHLNDLNNKYFLIDFVKETHRAQR